MISAVHGAECSGGQLMGRNVHRTEECRIRGTDNRSVMAHCGTPLDLGVM